MKKFKDWLNEKFQTDLTQFNLFESRQIFAGAHNFKRIYKLEDVTVDNEYLKAFFKYFLGLKKPKINSVGIPDNLDINKPIPYYITTIDNLNSSARQAASQVIKLNFEDKPVKITNKIYLYKCDKSILEDDSFIVPNIKLVKNDIDGGSPSNSEFYIGAYSKSKIDGQDTYTLMASICFKLEQDKETVSKLNNYLIKSNINDANMLIKECGFVKNNECVITLKDLPKFSDTLLNVIKNLNVSEQEYNVWFNLFNKNFINQSGEIDTSKLYKNDKIIDYKGTLLEFMNESNYGVIASEILIPVMLLSGNKIINGVNVLENITDDEDMVIKKVIWPLSSTAKGIDYAISYVEDQNGKRYGISAKSGISIHKTPLNSLLKYADEKLILKYKGKKDFISDLYTNIVTKYPNEISSKIVWLEGAYTINEKISDSELNMLLQLYEVLNNKNVFIEPKDKRFINSLLKSLKCDYESIPPKYKRCYPYSLTSYFETQINNKINENKELIKHLEYIRNNDINYNYTQIQLVPNKQYGFKLTILPGNKSKQKELGNSRLTIGSSNGSDKNKAITDDILKTKNSVILIVTLLKSKIGQFCFIDWKH